MKAPLIALCLAGVMASAPAIATAINGGLARQQLEAAGYSQIHDPEQDDGLWEADAIGPDQRRTRVAVDTTRGEIFDPNNGRPQLDARQVLDQLDKQGFANVRSLEREGATWDVEADDAQGRPRQLRLSGHDARVLHNRADHD
ncbi:PepSY domain-containing protein [Stenotrophomonas sp. JC08]|uniref:PepSY domain-containing protein n=1 Tax=Stenotrophomonas sp. JC08 TaxID=3445779 RepID=UPI003FA2CAD6